MTLAPFTAALTTFLAFDFPVCNAYFISLPLYTPVYDIKRMSLQQKNSTVLVKHGLLMASTLAAEATKAEGTASILWTAVVNMYYWGDNYKMQTSHTLCSRPKRYGAMHGGAMSTTLLKPNDWFVSLCHFIDFAGDLLA